ncbi:hypothetical protein PM082_023375 [Marasmius tenuissimus]|nr:hypothetical protein PM082_023375 [Marasmius tenuissimus]
MHLIFENVMKNLVLLGTGAYKGLDEGSGSYHLDLNIWEEIGKATAASASIPSCFGARPPNVVNDKQATTADSWLFWLLYLGPILLENKFANDVYYTHFLEFSTLIRLCLDFEYEEVIQDGSIRWVEKYEELYYQYEPERSIACPLTIHALLHVADMIKAMGPVWAYWVFPTERYCGRLQPAIRSKRYPFANINNYLISFAHLSELKVTYGLEKELSLKEVKSGVVKGQFQHSEYPSCVLLPPHKLSSTIPNDIHNKIMVHLATHLSSDTRNVTKTMIWRSYDKSAVTRWYKAHQLEGGDDMIASSLATYSEDCRDATFIWYDMLVDRNTRNRCAAPDLISERFYGQLKEILVVVLSASQEPGIYAETTFILAAIENCVVYGVNELDMPVYEKMGATEVVDITTIQCLVGHIRRKAMDHH